MQTGDRSADADNFNDVFDATSRDSGADTAAPEAQQQVARDDQGRFAPKDKPEAPKAEDPPQPQQEAERDTDANRHVPLKELLGERDRYKSERKLREEAEARAKSVQDELAALRNILTQQTNQQRQPAPQPQQQQPQEIPDPLIDPQGWAAHLEQQQFRSMRNQIANMSESIAVQTHGRAVVDAAVKAALEAGVARDFWASARDPYGELIQWHKQYTAFQDIGPDPTAYKTKLKDQLRQEILAELKAGGTKPQPKHPGSLVDVTPSGDQGQMLTDEAVANELFATTRNRKA